MPFKRDKLREQLLRCTTPKCHSRFKRLKRNTMEISNPDTTGNRRWCRHQGSCVAAAPGMRQPLPPHRAQAAVGVVTTRALATIYYPPMLDRAVSFALHRLTSEIHKYNISIPKR